MSDADIPEYVVSYGTRRAQRRRSSGLYSNASLPTCEYKADGDSCKPDDVKQNLSVSERWSACSQAMKHFDEVTIKGWKEDIDTLLVFAGLFSAVLTAFIVEIYKQLQPDPATLTVEILQQISVILVSRDTSQNVTNQDLLPASTASPPPSWAIRVNTVWFTALVFSLIAALIGIIAKQWLRGYITGMSTSSRESVRLRQYRHDGLVRWRVAEIIGVLPVLLQIALVLFLYGLLELLWTLDNTVASVVTVVTVISLSFYFSTIVAPAFSPNNPFKSPQSWTHVSIITGENIGIYESIPGSWREREVKYMRQEAGNLDLRALSRTYKHCLPDEDFLDVLFPCANDLEPSAAVLLAIEFLTRRAECSLAVLLDSIRGKSPRLVVEKFILRAGARGTHRLLNMLLDVLPRMLHDVERLKITQLDVLTIVRKLLTTDELALCEMACHRRALDTLSSLVDERCTEHVQRAALHLLWEMTRLGLFIIIIIVPTGIVNVILCARNAHSRRDRETFVHASGILLARLPAAQSRIHDPRWNGREWMRGWIHDVEAYFHDRNEANARYDPGEMKWCSGLASISLKDKAFVGESLVVALKEGARLALVDCDLEEGDALHDLLESYVKGSG
ncbi:hypothetical protein EUX98_g1952 [Antrodiella citrinella]|uniref:DUF6535 domain-containing protein n=1 Tax=Antrodiella citrinella TaxID=2447956 RepID=A0A4S4N2I4_9APHY|nr:hypothetical protein EUX98_g1952 [Antrodiella citrinella]